jgi:hypothetical protein
MKILLAAIAALASIAIAPTTADAKAIQLDERDHGGKVRVELVRHTEDRWHYVRLTNGAEWMMTRCAYWNSINCWFDAEVRTHAPVKSRPYININGRTIYLQGGGTVDRD